MVLAVPVLAQIQYAGHGTGYTIVTPGEPPTFVNPNYNSGYTAITPGAPPTFINRSFNGGYTVLTPGEPPTFVNPTIPSYPSPPVSGEDDGDDD
ncbi:MAG TPA: hypothetical protein VNF45_07115 [Candidatus Binataceae bacterium]|nr:hypothetical protein [Candidatus Binataceae bacterium]